MSVKRILTAKAKPDMVLAEDIYTSDNRLLVAIGTVLTPEIIQALQEYSIFAIRIMVKEAHHEEIIEAQEKSEDEYEEGAKPADTVKLSHGAQIRQTQEFQEFQLSFQRVVDHLKTALYAAVLNGDPLDSDTLLSDVYVTLDKSRNGLHILDMLHCMREYDDATFAHSVNVAMVSNVIGHMIQPPLRVDMVQELTLAALLHDVGKMLVPAEILNKKGKLTSEEYNVAKTHVLHGQNILQKAQMSEYVISAAVRHHERWDGSGYPGGMKGKDIPEFARIIAIADVYEAMTSPRPYRQAICPFQVLHYMERECITSFDPDFLMGFLDKASQSLIGVQVQLSDGREGKVLIIHPNDRARPVIQVEDSFLDLKDHPEVSIQNIIT